MSQSSTTRPPPVVNHLEGRDHENHDPQKASRSGVEKNSQGDRQRFIQTQSTQKEIFMYETTQPAMPKKGKSGLKTISMIVLATLLTFALNALFLQSVQAQLINVGPNVNQFSFSKTSDPGAPGPVSLGDFVTFTLVLQNQR